MPNGTVDHTDTHTDMQAGQGKEAIEAILLKRQVTIKTRVTDTFREKVRTELSDELRLIEAQLVQLESQYQSTLKQIEAMARQGQNVSSHMDQLNREVQEKRGQLATVKLQVSNNLANLDKVGNGDTIVTGVLENFVEVNLGDNLYEKIRGAEIVLEDGVVQTILG